jgi:predicted dehydrogenase
MSTLGVGVVGVGGIANTHYPGWQKSPHTEIVALSDINETILNRTGDKLDVSRRYLKFEDMLADPDVHIVDICTPSMYHAPLAIAALNAGKHVICEKPLAPEPEDVLEMIAARDASGKYLMTAQHFRFGGDARALKAEIDAGVLGDVYHARSWMLRRAWYPTGPTFCYKKHSGGGPVIDIGVHILDLTLWMMGHQKPVSVTGVTGDKLAQMPGSFSQWGGDIPRDADVEEFAAAFVRFDTGATLILEVSWLLHHSTSGEDMQMWLYGTKSGTHWPSKKIVSAANDLKILKETTLQTSFDLGEPHAAECVAFAQAIVDGAPSPVPAEQSLEVSKILSGLYRSSVEKREIRLD